MTNAPSGAFVAFWDLGSEALCRPSVVPLPTPAARQKRAVRVVPPGVAVATAAPARRAVARRPAVRVHVVRAHGARRHGARPDVVRADVVRAGVVRARRDLVATTRVPVE